MRLLNSAPSDTVTELLSRIRVKSSIYCLSELGAPWGFEVNGTDFAKFHLVIDGACWLRLDGADPTRLGQRELVILPRGERHAISDEPGSPTCCSSRQSAPTWRTRWRAAEPGNRQTRGSSWRPR